MTARWEKENTQGEHTGSCNEWQLHTHTMPSCRDFTTLQSMPGVSLGLRLAPTDVRYESSFSWGTLHPHPFSCSEQHAGSSATTLLAAHEKDKQGWDEQNGVTYRREVRQAEVRTQAQRSGVKGSKIELAKVGPPNTHSSCPSIQVAPAFSTPRCTCNNPSSTHLLRNLGGFRLHSSLRSHR